MAPRTLSSTWKQFEKLVKRCCSKSETAKKAVTQLDDLVQRANSSKITPALTSMFVEPYPETEEISVQFSDSENGAYPDWPTCFSPDDNTILVNPVGVIQFFQQCQKAAKKLKTPDARENFITYRYHAYLGELGKLPSQYMLFLMLLQEVASVRKIAEVDKKGGGKEPAHDETYINLLWAFKELEVFYRSAYGMNLRSEYGILWHECDWISGN